MQDVADSELSEMYRPSLSNSHGSPINQEHGARDSNGFIVQGGPWEQQTPQPQVAPNTASVTEFPSFGGRTIEEPQTSSVASAWGPRR